MLPFLTQGLLGDRQHPLSRSFLVALAFKAERMRSGLQSPETTVWTWLVLTFVTQNFHFRVVHISRMAVSIIFL